MSEKTYQTKEFTDKGHTYDGARVTEPEQNKAVLNAGDVGREKSSEKLTAQQQRVNNLRNMVRQGVEKARNDEGYKAWLRTQAHNFTNKYSFNNILRVAFQKPDASTVMGYEQWKGFGRQVKAGAKGVEILVPVSYKEKRYGNLCRDIISSLSTQLKIKSNASLRLNDSGMVFSMKQGSTDIVLTLPNGKNVVFADRQQLNSFLQKNILGKMPRYYAPQNVFDVKDVYVPTFLSMKRGFKEFELVKGCGEGQAIENKEGQVLAKAKWSKNPDAPKGYEWVAPAEIGKGVWELVSEKAGEPIITNPHRREGDPEYLILNSPERIAKFKDELEMKVISQNKEAMGTLFEAIKAYSEEMKVPVRIISKDSPEWTASKEANGYYHKATGTEKAVYDRGYIVIPKELLESDPTHACKTLIHELAHADLHGNIRDLEAEMGEKVTLAMKETQAESVAFMVCEHFGIDSSDYSFKYLATWASDADLSDFDKSLKVIDEEAKLLVDKINASLENRGLTRNLTPIPKEALSNDTIKARCTTFAMQMRENNKILSNLKRDIVFAISKAQGNKEKLEILTEQRENIKKREAEVDLQLDLLEKLDGAASRDIQDDLINQLNCSFERDKAFELAYGDLQKSLQIIAIRNKEGLCEQFYRNPMATINKLAKTYPQLKELSKVQKQYIAKSGYIKEQYAPELSSNVDSFVDKVTQRADYIVKIASKNGTFVEIINCEATTDPPIFRGGELAHPKVVDKIFIEGENQIRELKANNTYYPSTDVRLAIYSLSEKGNITCNIGKLEVGGRTEMGLFDYLVRANAEKKELIAKYEASMHERNIKNKILGAEYPHGESITNDTEEKKLSFEEISDEINAKRDDETLSAEHSEKTRLVNHTREK